jgi:diacylglycerol kinase
MVKPDNSQNVSRQSKKSVSSLLKSFKYAFNGIAHVFRNERNFRLHVFSSILVLILATYFQCDLIEFALLMIVMSVVLITEIINSAIEYTWDKLEPNHHPVVGIIKDAMSGSVLLASLSAFFVGIMIIVRHLI